MLDYTYASAYYNPDHLEMYKPELGFETLELDCNFSDFASHINQENHCKDVLQRLHRSLSSHLQRACLHQCEYYVLNHFVEDHKA